MILYGGTTTGSFRGPVAATMARQGGEGRWKGSRRRTGRTKTNKNRLRSNFLPGDDRRGSFCLLFGCFDSREADSSFMTGFNLNFWFHRA